MPQRLCNVLLLCTGNSARSIMAEAILNRLAPGRFRAYSAGSRPRGTVHPDALEVLRHCQYATDDLRSKSWQDFTVPQAPPIDVVITLCDDAASEPCPLWPGRPVTAHWGMPDPAAIPQSAEARRQAFVETLRRLQQFLGRLVEVPVSTLDRHSVQQRLAALYTQTLHHT